MSDIVQVSCFARNWRQDAAKTASAYELDYLGWPKILRQPEESDEAFRKRVIAANPHPGERADELDPSDRRDAFRND